MHLDTKKEASVDKKKPCTFCLLVRWFAIAAFLLTIAFYFYEQSQKHVIGEKEQAVIRATMEANLR